MASSRRPSGAHQVPAPQARDKLAFLLALVPWLLEHDRVSVHETAAHFGVSADEVRASVALVATSGIPGDTATYQHDDLFDIDWDAFETADEIAITHHVAIEEAPRLSAREAAALIAGLQYLQTLPENADRASIRALVEKLSRGASAPPSPLGVSGGQHGELLERVQRAVSAGRRVRFGYLSARGEHEQREVDPLRVESIDADWYLRGWDHRRDALRTFRFDRMDALEITEQPIEHDATEVNLPDTLFEPSAEDLEVTLEVVPAALGLISDYLTEGARTEQHGDRIRATVRVPHYHGLKRLVAGMPDTVRVVAPEQARQAVAGGLRRGSHATRRLTPPAPIRRTSMFIHTLAWNQPLTWVIVLVVVLVLFGATRLPALSKSIGQSVKIFRNEMKSDDADKGDSESQQNSDTTVDGSTPSDKS